MYLFTLITFSNNKPIESNSEIPEKIGQVRICLILADSNACLLGTRLQICFRWNGVAVSARMRVYTRNPDCIQMWHFELVRIVFLV